MLKAQFFKSLLCFLVVFCKLDKRLLKCLMLVPDLVQMILESVDVTIFVYWLWFLLLNRLFCFNLDLLILVNLALLLLFTLLLLSIFLCLLNLLLFHLLMLNLHPRRMLFLWILILNWFNDVWFIGLDGFHKLFFDWGPFFVLAHQFVKIFWVVWTFFYIFCDLYNLYFKFEALFCLYLLSHTCPKYK